MPLSPDIFSQSITNRFLFLRKPTNIKQSRIVALVIHNLLSTEAGNYEKEERNPKKLKSPYERNCYGIPPSSVFPPSSFG